MDTTTPIPPGCVARVAEGLVLFIEVS
jgi:hypothetical protein